MARVYLTRFICLFLAVMMLASCTVEGVSVGKSVKRVQNESSRLIDEHFTRLLDDIYSYDSEGEFPYFEGGVQLTGSDIVRGLQSEEGGEDMLLFISQIESYDSVDEVLDAVKWIVPSSQLDEIRSEAVEVENQISSMVNTRALSATQSVEFKKEVRALVVKTTVLLAAAIVYAILPTTIFWGKISAAAAVSIAAGVVASTLMSLICRYNTDDYSNSAEMTFTDWVEEVSKEPAVNWAIALGVINTTKAMGMSPLMTGLILAVFAIYNIIDDVKPLLENYNWKA